MFFRFSDDGLCDRPIVLERVVKPNDIASSRKVVGKLEVTGNKLSRFGPARQLTPLFQGGARALNWALISPPSYSPPDRWAINIQIRILSDQAKVPSDPIDRCSFVDWYKKIFTARRRLAYNINPLAALDRAGLSPTDFYQSRRRFQLQNRRDCIASVCAFDSAFFIAFQSPAELPNKVVDKPATPQLEASRSPTCSSTHNKRRANSQPFTDTRA